MATISNFYKKLRDLCEQNGMTVNELAASLGLSSGSPTAWKNGTVPRLKTIERIAEYFGVMPDVLLEQKETPIPVSEDERNVVRMAGRDGSYVVRRLSDEQYAAFQALLEQLPDADF